ncbi:MAG: dTMP kinase [Cardiobacteriaceae bacterium]|nr:dTMP kinase [Cardiobacteriaceae bacterium]
MIGRFITLDGSEGVGKTTQMANIRQWCEEQNIVTHFSREPGGTLLGEQLRTILLDHNTQADPISELLLFLAARRAHLQNEIIPRLERGEWVICDRYRDATYAYQHYGRGIPLETLHSLEHLTETNKEADIAFILGSSNQTAQARLIARSKEKDRFEIENEAFFMRVAQGYRALSEKPKHYWIDAEGDAQNVFSRILPHLEKLLPNHTSS